MSLPKIYEEQLCTDLQVCIFDSEQNLKHTINVHKGVLCAQSYYFRGLLLGQFKENNSGTVNLTTEYPDAMKNVILSLYDMKPPLKKTIDTIAQYINCRSYLMLEVNSLIVELSTLPVKTLEDFQEVLEVFHTYEHATCLMKEIYDYLTPEKIPLVFSVLSDQKIIFLKRVFRQLHGIPYILPIDPIQFFTVYITGGENHRIKTRQVCQNKNHLYFSTVSFNCLVQRDYKKLIKYEDTDYYQIYDMLIAPNFIGKLKSKYTFRCYNTGDTYKVTKDNEIIQYKSNIITFRSSLSGYCAYNYDRCHELVETIDDIYATQSNQYFLVKHQNGIATLDYPRISPHYPQKFTLVIPSLLHDFFFLLNEQRQLYIIDFRFDDDYDQVNELMPNHLPNIKITTDLVTVNATDNLVLFHPPEQKITIIDSTNGKLIQEHLLNISGMNVDWEKTRRIYCDLDDNLYVETGNKIFKVDMSDDYKCQLIYENEKTDVKLGGLIYNPKIATILTHIRDTLQKNK